MAKRLFPPNKTLIPPGVQFHMPLSGLPGDHFLCLNHLGDPVPDMDNNIIICSNVPDLRKALKDRLQLYPIFEPDDKPTIRLGHSWTFQEKTGTKISAPNSRTSLPGNMKIVGFSLFGLGQHFMLEQEVYIPPSLFPSEPNPGLTLWSLHGKSIRKVDQYLKNQVDSVLDYCFKEGKLRIVNIKDITLGITHG